MDLSAQPVLKGSGVLYTVIRGQTVDGDPVEHRLGGSWGLDELRDWAKAHGLSGGVEVSLHGGSTDDSRLSPALARFHFPVKPGVALQEQKAQHPREPGHEGQIRH